MKTILAIDPGSEMSGIVFWNGEVVYHDIASNGDILKLLDEPLVLDHEYVAIEMIASYGMPVGKEVFETCVWIGRFMERSLRPVRLVYRKDIKMHLCGTPRAKDANIRQALIDKYGAPGTKSKPGATYGISGHLWSALAVACYASEVDL